LKKKKKQKKNNKKRKTNKQKPKNKTATKKSLCPHWFSAFLLFSVSIRQKLLKPGFPDCCTSFPSHAYSSVNEGAWGAAAELADVAGPGVTRITTNNSSWSFLLGTMICGLSKKI